MTHAGRGPTMWLKSTKDKEEKIRTARPGTERSWKTAMCLGEYFHFPKVTSRKAVVDAKRKVHYPPETMLPGEVVAASALPKLVEFQGTYATL